MVRSHHCPPKWNIGLDFETGSARVAACPFSRRFVIRSSRLRRASLKTGGRKTIYKNEWWFSIVDVVAALTDSNIPRRYWSDLKIKLKKEGFTEVYEKIVQLKLEAPDGKLRDTDCANTETIFRIIQTIPSPKQNHLKDG